MSDIPRYSANPLWFPWSFVDNPMGKFCEYRDYVKLQAENGRLRHEQKMRAIPVEAQLLDRLQELKAENERLRKAVELMDKVEEEWDRMQRSESGGADIMYAVSNWKRYKKGRDAK